jgi:hypothetical protein
MSDRSFTDSSSFEVRPGFVDDFIDLSATPGRLTIRSSAQKDPSSEWIPVAASVSPWLDFAALNDLDSNPLESLSDWQTDWLSLGLLFESDLARDGLAEDQPVTWQANLGSETQPPGVSVNGNTLNVDLSEPITAAALVEGAGLVAQDVEAFTHFVVYAAFARVVNDDGDLQVRYSFERVQPNSEGLLVTNVESTLVVTNFDASNAHSQAEQALFGSAAVATNFEINGFTEEQLASTSDTPTRNLGAMFGSFSNGRNIVGIDSGLVMVPGYTPTAATEPGLLDDVPDDDRYVGTEQAFSPPEYGDGIYPDSVIGALARAMVRNFIAALPKQREASPIDTALDDAVITAPDEHDPAVMARLDAVAGRLFD